VIADVSAEMFASHPFPRGMDRSPLAATQMMSSYELLNWVRCPECNHPDIRIITFPRWTVGMKCGYCSESTIDVVRSISIK